MVKKSWISQTFADFKAIPKTARQASLNLIIFSLGWGIGTDTFFAIYLKSIVDNLFWVGILGAFFAFTKLLVNLPIGEIDGNIDERRMLKFGKIIYAFAGLIYFAAGYWHQPLLLALALTINGLANPMVFTTTQSHLRQHSTNKTSCRIFGLYNMAISIPYVIGALIAAYLVQFLELHWFYLFVTFFALISIPLDKKLKETHNKPLKQELKRVLIDQNIYTKVLKDLKKYDFHMFFMLFIIFMWSLLEYTSFLFVPILALEHSLSLSQIAILFAIIKIPYIISFIFADLADKREPMSILGLAQIAIAALLGILAMVDGFLPIILTTVTIGLFLAIMRAVASGVITNLTATSQRSEITGVQEFMARFGAIIGSFGFGWAAQSFGLSTSFGALAILVITTAVVTLSMKHYNREKHLFGLIDGPLNFFYVHARFPNHHGEDTTPDITKP